MTGVRPRNFLSVARAAADKGEKMKDKKSFYEEVIEVLKKDKRFVSEKGEILRNAVIEAAQKMDAKLLKALRSNVTTRKRFYCNYK